MDEHLNRKPDIMRGTCNLNVTSASSLFLYLELSYYIAQIQIRTGVWLETVAIFWCFEVMRQFLSNLFSVKM